MKKIPFLLLIKKSSITLFLILSCLFSVSGQGWTLAWTIAGGGLDTVRNDVIHLPSYANGRTYPLSLFFEADSEIFHFSRIDGEYSYAHSSGTNPSGNSSTISYFPKSSVMLGPDSTIVLSDKYNPVTGDYDLFATCFINDGSPLPNTMIWHQPVYENPANQVTGAALQHTQNGHLISLGSVQSEVLPNGIAHELLLVKSDLNGQILWTTTYSSLGDDLGVQVVPSSDGGYYLLKNVQANLSLPDVAVWLVKTDENGLLEWEVNLGVNDVAFDMIATNDGGLAITGTNVNQDLFVLKTDDIGNQIWRQDYPAPDRSMTGRGIIEDLQNHLIVAGRLTFDTNGNVDPFIAKLTENGTPLWERIIGKTDRNDGFNDIALTPEGNYLMGGFRQLISNSGSLGSFHGYLAKSDTFGIVRGGNVHGNIFHDMDLDCLPTSDELNLENWKVQVVNDTLNYYGNTDAQGNYWIPVEAKSGDSIDYVVSVVPPSNYWGACVNDIPITIHYLDTVQIDFAMEALVSCPFLEAQISNTNFRPCEPATIYLTYCNNGTSIADSATIDVTLDEYLAFNNSTITPSQIDGQTYTFPLGDLDIGECGDFSISVTVDCDSVEIGDALCLEAHIYPDSLCTVPNQMWSGALLQLSYTCDSDSVQYNIKNIGTETSQLLDYIIIEDAVLLLEGDVELPSTISETPSALPLNGSTYHLIAQQEPGAPGPEWISLGTMGCNSGNSSAQNQFPQYTGGPFIITYCPIVVGSFDPNDKQAIPSGFDDEHYILPNTDLNYTIRFQNTGTDTAFRVVILDTLTNYLNPATVVPGPSSHPYEFRFLDDGVLSFTFHDIELPDSSANFAASQGFVTFKIDQDPNLPSGTLIENNASIYFDFNLPILTNTTFHTITQLIDIVSGSVSVATPQLEVKVMPNPMQGGAWIQLEGHIGQDPLTIKLFDVSGKMVKQVQGYENNIWLDRASLASGMYFFTVENKEGWLASGKIVAD